MRFQFKNQESNSLRQRAATDIRDAIIRGNLLPGDKLREIDISQQMGISRGPVREAIRDLEALGLVVSHPYRETVVADVSKEEITFLLIPIRLQIELYAIKYNMANYNEDFLFSLQQIIDQMEENTKKDKFFELIEDDIRFHESIISFDGSHYIQQIWASIVNRLRLHFIKNTKKFTDLNKVHNDHILLLEVLQTKDYDQIVKVWTQHIHHEDCLLCFH